MTTEQIVEAVRRLRDQRNEARAEAERWETAYMTSEETGRALKARVEELLGSVRELSGEMRKANSDLNSCKVESDELTRELKLAREEIARWRDLAGIGNDDPEPPIVVDPPQPPPVEPPSDAPWTHGVLDLNFRWAKEFAEDRVNAVRGPVNTKTDRRGALNFKSSAKGTGPIVIEDEARQPTWKWGYNAYVQGLIETEGITMRNVEMVAPPAGDMHRLMWFARLWNLPSFEADGVTVEGGLLDDPERPWPREHGIYENVSGDSTVTRSIFKSIGGHGRYMAHRPAENGRVQPNNRPYTASPQHYVGDCAFIDNDMDALRGAHAITFFDAGTSEHPGVVLIEDTSIISSWPFERGQGSNDRWEPGSGLVHRPVRACGGIVCHNYYYEGGEHPLHKVALHRVLIKMDVAGHALADLRNAREYVIDGCAFEAASRHRNPWVNVGCTPKNIGGDAPTIAPEQVAIRNTRLKGCKIRIWKTPTEFDVVEPDAAAGDFIWTP